MGKRQAGMGKTGGREGTMIALIGGASTRGAELDALLLHCSPYGVCGGYCIVIAS